MTFKFDSKFKIKNSKLVIAFFAFVFFVLAPSVHAATLYFSPSSGSYEIGKTFSVGIYVSSSDKAMNAASGIISFPADKLEVVSLSKTDSIFNLWVQEPVFSNSQGNVNFEGIVLNPGFTGAIGKIISVNFKAKTAGSANLNFSSGSVLANDGYGTNILTTLGDAAFSLSGAAPAAPKAPLSAAPVISSPTHSDSDKWYANKDAKFTWPVPSGVSRVRLLADKIPRPAPAVVYSPAISEKEITDLEDGIWYLHAQFRNPAGWGEVSHFRFQIDTEKPELFGIREIVRSDLTEPKARFFFNASDKTSGIDYYEIRINNESPQVWRDDGSHIYETNAFPPGKHTLIAKVVDKAGNALESSAEFVVESPELPPVIDWPKVAAAFIAFLILILFIVWYRCRNKFFAFRKKLRKKTREAESALHKAFDLLREDVREHIKMLEKAKTRRELTEEEEKIMKQLKKDLDDAEKLVRKEIEGIEREIK